MELVRKGGILLLVYLAVLLEKANGASYIRIAVRFFDRQRGTVHPGGSGIYGYAPPGVPAQYASAAQG